MASAAPFFAEDDRGVWQRARATGNNPHHADPDLCSWSRDMAGTISDRLNNRGFSRQRGATNGFFKNAVSHNSSKSFQNSSPSSSPQQYGGERMPQSIGTDPKTFDPDKSETRTSLHRALTLHVSDPAKIVARKTGASVDTVDNHRAGNVPQSWAQLIAYCRAYPAFGLEVLEMIGIDIDRDREAYSLFLILQQRVRGS